MDIIKKGRLNPLKGKKIKRTLELQYSKLEIHSTVVQGTEVIHTVNKTDKV